MDKQGIGLSLSFFVGLILSIAAAILLSMVGANIYDILFPSASLEKVTEQSILEIISRMEIWDQVSTRHMTTVIPFKLGSKNLAIFFNADEDKVVFVNDRVLPKPPVKQCKNDACVCVFFNDHKDQYKFEQNPVDRDPILGCWVLKDIDYVFTPSTLHIEDIKVIWSYFYVKQNQRASGVGNDDFSSSNLGKQAIIPEEYIREFQDKEYAYPILHGGYEKAGDQEIDPVFEPYTLYLEKTSIGTKNYLFMTPSTDKVLAHRKTVMDLAVSS